MYTHTGSSFTFKLLKTIIIFIPEDSLTTNTTGGNTKHQNRLYIVLRYNLSFLQPAISIALIHVSDHQNPMITIVIVIMILK